MLKIALVNVWIGKYPETFPLWLRSAELNPTIEYFLVSDNDWEWDIKNVHHKKMTLSEVKSVFEEELNMKICLKTPYKLCDYKILWRTLFREELEEYDYWGYVDLDIIMGNIRKQFTDELFVKYDKLLESGYMTYYRNVPEINELYKKSVEKDNMAYPYTKAFKNGYACYFDEYMGMNILAWNDKNIRVFRDQEKEEFIQDFSWQKLQFTSYIKHVDFVFNWQQGTMYRVYVDGEGKVIHDESGKPKQDEIIFAHIQKRQMRISDRIKESFEDISEIHDYWIIPNEFTEQMPKAPLYTEEEKKEYTKLIAEKDKQRSINNLKRNGIIQYIPHMLRRRKIVKWIRSVKGYF